MAASELFCAGEYVLYTTRDRVTVVSCQVTDTYYALRGDYEKLSHGMYALELCAAAIQPAKGSRRPAPFPLRVSPRHGDMPFSELVPEGGTTAAPTGVSSASRMALSDMLVRARSTE
jgi:hypothetical protein